MAAKKKAAVAKAPAPDRASELRTIIAQEESRKVDGPENGPSHNEERLKQAEEELAKLT